MEGAIKPHIQLHYVRNLSPLIRVENSLLQGMEEVPVQGRRWVTNARSLKEKELRAYCDRAVNGCQTIPCT
jgi:hypothetical protein